MKATSNYWPGETVARQLENGDAFIEKFPTSDDADADGIERIIKAKAPESLQTEYIGGDWLSGPGAARIANGASAHGKSDMQQPVFRSDTVSPAGC